jgi:hypothetical protein
MECVQAGVIGAADICVVDIEHVRGGRRTVGAGQVSDNILERPSALCGVTE